MPSETSLRNVVLNSRLLIGLVTVWLQKGKKICTFFFFPVGFKCLSPLLAAPLKPGLYHCLLSPSRKLMTRLEEYLRELDSIFRCYSSLSSLLKVFHSFFASISLSSIVIPDSFTWWFERY